MQLQGSDLLKGQTVYALLDGEWKAGEVMDTNEHLEAAKILYTKNTKTGKFKSEWFSVKDLSRTK